MILSRVEFPTGIGSSLELGDGFVRPLSMDVVIEDAAGRLRPTDFEDFYRLSWSLVYRPLAATLGDADLACESTDEAMARAFARWDTVRNTGNPEGWVYRVAYRWALDRLRRRRRLRLLLPRLGTHDHGDGYMVEPGLDVALAGLAGLRSTTSGERRVAAGCSKEVSRPPFAGMKWEPSKSFRRPTQ